MRFGILGGTFDPIHCAHLEVGREAVARFSLDRVLFIPAGNPPHKPAGSTTAFEHRLEMVRLACAGDTRFEVSDVERGPGKSFTFETLRRLRAQMGPEDELFFVIGADAFAEVGTWYRWRDVVAETEFIVVTRPGHAYAAPEGGRVHRLDTLALPVSSSEIRRRIAAGEPVAEVPQAVREYIERFGLYRAPAPGVDVNSRDSMRGT